MKKQKYDFLVVGSGLYGSVCAEQLSKSGKNVLVIDKRSHIGGNCYSSERNGIIYHLYGPHVFHTDDQKTWNYIRQFATWRTLTHSVKTLHKGKIYDFPINLKTMNEFYGFMRHKTPFVMRKFLAKKTKKDTGNNLESFIVSQIGPDLYKAFIRDYTRKQWNKDPKDLPASIIKRIPIRFNYNASYFDDPIQAIPVGGYTPLFENMLKKCHIVLDADFLTDRDYFSKQAKHIIYTGPIDKFYNYTFGKLEWRSLRFQDYMVQEPDYQGIGVMHHPGMDVTYTRTMEWKHLHPESNNTERTLVTFEHPWDVNEITRAEPYYPIDTINNILTYRSYEFLSLQEKNIFFGGRLAEYRYYDMDDVIKKALQDIQTIGKR